jgi:hypothetical protein
MKISEAISRVKKYHKGLFMGKPIDDATSRDQVLYGNPDQELTRIVTSCYASVDVIKEAISLGANLIITHEALFWNHGDHTDWLTENKTFHEKERLLKEGNIVVWRDHDYIHSGIPTGDGQYSDGIFYGFMKVLGWDEYYTGDAAFMHPTFLIPPATVEDLGHELMSKLNLSGIKVIGNPSSPAHHVWVCGHIDGHRDNDTLSAIENENIDTVITLECIDYTVAEYVRDSTMAGIPKTILALGHFNAEEPGMKYMVNYLPKALGETVPCDFVPSTDMYHFIH